MEPSLTCTLPDLAATSRLAARVAEMCRAGDAILLEGPLGAGKSAFARAFVRHAVGDQALDVPSPTFTLVQSYDLPRFRIHHFDLWRIAEPSAVIELGWEEALDGVVLVEWPERLGALRPRFPLSITLRPVAETCRRALLRGWSDRLAGLADHADLSGCESSLASAPLIRTS